MDMNKMNHDTSKASSKFETEKIKKNPSQTPNNFNNGQQMFDYSEKTIRNERDASPRRQACPDEMWQKFENQAQDEKGALALRSDTVFLDKLLQLLQMQIGDILKIKDKKLTFQCGLKVFCLIMMKTKIEDDSKIDIIKNSKIPISLIHHLKHLIHQEQAKSHLDLASDLVRSIGLLAKTNFDKEVGIDTIYIKSVVPLIS